MNSLLTFQSLYFNYPGVEKPVLDALDLHIDPGTVTVLLGPNGAGKTTLLNLVLGWLKPSAGEVCFQGRNLQSYSRRELGQKMALVPQLEHIAFEFTVLDYVLLGRTPYLRPLDMPTVKDMEIAGQALKQTGIHRLAQRAVTSLSGGERQLVLLARSLAQQPELLLLDEPSSHLDLANKARLIKILKTLNAQDVSILLSTHEPEVASALATHLVLVRDGQVLAAGPFDALFTSAHLGALYGLPVEVIKASGRKVALY
jgi:iron complex transport system ATP-binding protein